jgi:hypothetical protein
MMETKERVLQWLTGSDTCFLIGAGCSRCAGKPLIGELTTKVLANVNASIKTEFDGLKGIGTRPPTIEDLINYLVRYQSILQTVQDAAKHTLKPDWIDSALQAIKKEIVTHIADGWVDSPVHARFLQRIGNKWSKTGRDIFSLNYDTIIEATLDNLRYYYVDGFRGSRRASPCQTGLIWYYIAFLDTETRPVRLNDPISTNQLFCPRLPSSLDTGTRCPTRTQYAGALRTGA